MGERDLVCLFSSLSEEIEAGIILHGYMYIFSIWVDLNSKSYTVMTRNLYLAQLRVSFVRQANLRSFVGTLNSAAADECHRKQGSSEKRPLKVDM